MKSAKKSLLRARSLPNKGSLNDQDAKFKEIKSLIDSIQSEVSSKQHPEKEASKATSSVVSEEYTDPFFDPPPSLGLRSSYADSGITHDDHSVDLMEAAFLSKDALMHVAVESSIQRSSFYIPISLMLEREQTMRVTAESFGIGPNRWTSSLLYREWRNALDNTSDASSTLTPVLAVKQSNGDVAIHMSPEKDCAESNHSHSFKWEPWLTTCIRAFYNTGTVRIPDDVCGSEILLALEYFGIVYMPEQLVFDSFGAYLRVKLWSEYYTHRTTLAEWIVQRILTSHSKHSHIFVTSPSSYESDIMVGSQRAVVLEGGLLLDPSKYDTTPSCAVVHDFFQDDQQLPQQGDSSTQASPSNALDGMMREDLANFIQHSLPGTRVRFDLRSVQVGRSSRMVQRGVLHIDYVPTPQTSVTAPEAIVNERKTTIKKDQPSIDESQNQPSIDQSRNPIRLLKRVGSGKRRNKSISGSSKQSITTAPSAEHVYDDLQKKVEPNQKQKKAKASTKSVDYVYSKLNHKGNVSLGDSKLQLRVQEALKPSTQEDHTKREREEIMASPEPTDERMNLYSTDPRAPVRSIAAELDHVSVVSGLTSPFRDDDTTARSIKAQRVKAQRDKAQRDKYSAALSSSIRSMQESLKKVGSLKSVMNDQSTNGDTARGQLGPLPDEGTIGTVGQSTTLSEVFKTTATHPPPAIAASSGMRSIKTTKTQAAQPCNGDDMLTSTLAYFFGGDEAACKDNNRPSRYRTYSEESSKTGAMSTIEKFLPDLDLQSHAQTIKDVSSRKSDPSKPREQESMETDAAAWLRNAISLKKFDFLYEDPLRQRGNNEYARMVRQTPRYREKKRPPAPTGTKAPTMFNNFLDALMLDDNSLIDPSTEATSMSGTTMTTMRTMQTHSTKFSGVTSAVTEETSPSNHIDRSSGSPKRSPPNNTMQNRRRKEQQSNQRVKKFGRPSKGLVDDIDDMLDSVLSDEFERNNDKGVERLVQRMIASQERDKQAAENELLEHRDSPPSSSRKETPSRRRRRFMTPQKERIGDAPPPRDTTKGTRRFVDRSMSPLKRFPFGKKKGDSSTSSSLNLAHSDSTPKVNNVVSPLFVPSSEETEDETRNDKPNRRIAGLFRSKGLVRRRSLQGNSKTSDASSRDQTGLLEGEIKLPVQQRKGSIKKRSFGKSKTSEASSRDQSLLLEDEVESPAAQGRLYVA